MTGIPAGVGVFREPSVYLKDGDEVVVEIQGNARLINICKVR
jgi:2-keto-4-pentenoate hydratase/2-oxohepta-3-ene-1,7-dioic acid hydratase in catechol pathway